MSSGVEWTEHERALWRSCEVVRDRTLHGVWPDPISVGFAHQIDHEERIFLWSEFQRSWFGASGDGSYQTSTFVAGGFSPLGVMLGAATLGASAAGNAARKSRARKAAAETWRQLDAGHLYVSSHGFYLCTDRSVLAFGFHSIMQADLGGPGVLLATISMSDGAQRQYAITTIWAELLFVLWAQAYCVGHPRLQNLAFLPPEFIQRADYAGVWNSSPMQQLHDGS